MATTHITFRGEPDVEIEYRMGRYESDTGAQECEWFFVDRVVDDMTPEEEEEITAGLYRIEDEPPEGSISLSSLLPRGEIRGTPISELSGRIGEKGYAEFCRIARSWGHP